MNILLRVLALCLLLIGAAAHATEAAPEQARQELIDQLERDGYLSPTQAQEVRQKYLGPQASQARSSNEPGLVQRFVTLANFFKLLAVILLLIWARGMLRRFAAGLWYVVALLPKEVYQASFLLLGLVLTIRPDSIWPSQAFYLALFGAFGNLMVLGWIIESHAALREALQRWFGTGLLATALSSTLALLYFGALALAYESQVFGFFAAVSLSSMLCFGMSYSPGLLTLHVRDKALAAVVLGHLLVLLAYSAARLSGHWPPVARVFDTGLQYYCTIAMGTGFLIGASPFRFMPRRLSYLALFLLVLGAALAAYHLADFKVIGSILSVFGVLLALEWLGHLCWRSGFLRGSFIMGITLFAASLAAERFAGFLVWG
ncbi:hypothetical protein [Inhella proteolytica]|uniref:DUF2157 domain-containing protein n=1 Tax=Inhella proteolytica TaxID=2795029 RepID=A0A931J3C3_9BURK|nr:hypothetical protein [Inhella proteolytica]MBH9575430.1 hypothetical protein [Inhella proteolytica]